jgi:hypothetical protein
MISRWSWVQSSPVGSAKAQGVAADVHVMALDLSERSVPGSNSDRRG